MLPYPDLAHEFGLISRQRLVQRVGEQVERVIDADRLRRGAIADQIGQDDPVTGRDKGIDILAEVRCPRCARAAAVDEHHGRAGGIARLLDADLMLARYGVTRRLQCCHEIPKARDAAPVAGLSAAVVT